VADEHVSKPSFRRLTARTRRRPGGCGRVSPTPSRVSPARPMRGHRACVAGGRRRRRGLSSASPGRCRTRPPDHRVATTRPAPGRAHRGDQHPPRREQPGCTARRRSRSTTGSPPSGCGRKERGPRRRADLKISIGEHGANRRSRAHRSRDRRLSRRRRRVLPGGPRRQGPLVIARTPPGASFPVLKGSAADRPGGRRNRRPTRNRRRTTAELARPAPLDQRAGWGGSDRGHRRGA
jgi:hypothetical protein